MSCGVSIVSGKLPARYACAPDELALERPLALQARELVHHQAQHLAGRLGARVGFRDEVAGLLAGFGVRRGTVGQPALGPQHVVQPVRAFAAEDLHREVPRQVVGMLPRNRQHADANLGLHRVRLVDDDDATGGRRRFDRLGRRDIRARPAAEHALGRRERLVARHVADDRQDHVVRDEVALVVRLQILARDPRQRLGRAAARQAIRMEAVDEAIEQHAGHVVGVVAVDLQRGDGLLLLAIDLFRRQTPGCGRRRRADP